jgi:hypothetical protein
VTALFHFTCEHGHAGIEQTGEIVPGEILKPELRIWWPARYAWLTDRAEPSVCGLGLTRLYQNCDRTKYRYRVTDTDACFRWQFARGRHLESRVTEELEGAHGADPATWWVSTEPVPAVLDMRHVRR